MQQRLQRVLCQILRLGNADKTCMKLTPELKPDMGGRHAWTRESQRGVKRRSRPVSGGPNSAQTDLQQNKGAWPPAEFANSSDTSLRKLLTDSAHSAYWIAKVWAFPSQHPG